MVFRRLRPLLKNWRVRAKSAPHPGSQSRSVKENNSVHVESRGLRRVSRVVALAIGLVPAAAFAGSCRVNLDDVKEKITSFAKQSRQ